ncbi:ribosomal protein S15 [Mortierella polycephala]|uniref:Ribosomal protein S15 n=1 Tax=Mortierella polycephala TaxID=41804 RepID=A0A9P6QIL2_9FUNG|nr:ribosomal protein S15 [Mortierella polycephala]
MLEQWIIGIEVDLQEEERTIDLKIIGIGSTHQYLDTASKIVFMISDTADENHDAAAVDVKRKRTFRKFSYRGIDLDKLLDLTSEELMDLVNARPRRRFQRGLKRKPMGLIKKLRQAKKDAPAMEKPAVVKTHLRNMIIVPEMIGSVVGVYNGKTFNQVEIKPEMIGHYLGEFSITYKPVKHGRPGIGATHSSRFIPLK